MPLTSQSHPKASLSPCRKSDVEREVGRAIELDLSPIGPIVKATNHNRSTAGVLTIDPSTIEPTSLVLLSCDLSYNASLASPATCCDPASIINNIRTPAVDLLWFN